MKCYRCSHELSDTDEVCPSCGSKVVKLKNKKVEVRDVKGDYYNFSVGLIITKLLSFLLMFLSYMYLLFPWTLISLIFSSIGLIKYKDKRHIKLIIIDAIIIIGEIIVIIYLYSSYVSFIKKIINLS